MKWSTKQYQKAFFCWCCNCVLARAWCFLINQSTHQQILMNCTTSSWQCVFGLVGNQTRQDWRGIMISAQVSLLKSLMGCLVKNSCISERRCSEYIIQVCRGLIQSLRVNAPEGTTVTHPEICNEVTSAHWVRAGSDVVRIKPLD